MSQYCINCSYYGNCTFRNKVQSLEALIAKKNKALRAIEWDTWEALCPACGGRREQGHYPDCIIKQALTNLDDKEWDPEKWREGEKWRTTP